MKTIKHYIALETEIFNENDKVAQALLSLPKDIQEIRLTELAYTVLTPIIEKELIELNKNNSFAVLKLVKQ
jgi:hypothetical protein